jgi:hypothetical protein
MEEEIDNKAVKKYPGVRFLKVLRGNIAEAKGVREKQGFSEVQL